MKHDLEALKAFIYEYWFLAALYTAAIWAALLLAQDAFKWSGGTIADWFQTGGTVAAILTTWALTLRQSRENATEGKERSIGEICDKLMALLDISRTMDFTMNRQIDFANMNNAPSFYETERDLTNLSNLLNKFAIHEFPYSLVAVDVLNYVQATKDFQEIARVAIRSSDARAKAKMAKLYMEANDLCITLQISFHMIKNKLRKRAGLPLPTNNALTFN